MSKQDTLRLPVVSAGAKHLVMGYLMRRNILTYEAPPNIEGYDLICTHPNPKDKPSGGEREVVRVQVTSRYATDCDREFPVEEGSFDAFDFLIVAFLNIGKFYWKDSATKDSVEPEFFTFPNRFIREHFEATASWQKVRLRGQEAEIERFKSEAGFEQIAVALGIPRPRKAYGT
jgi:hypothetical protein